MNQPSPSARSSLAPSGRLRVGLNFSNFLLVAKDPASGSPRGIAVDLANELGRRAGVAVDFVAYASGGKMADAAGSSAWDIAFFAAEPERANAIDFTAAYLEIDATYLVPGGSSLRSIAEVDREGVRISVSEGSAYELFLKRTIRRAQLVRSASIGASFDRFVAEKLEALAGLKPRLVADAARLPGSRLLEGRFTAIQQAIGTPKGRDAAIAYAREFVEDIKASGLVAQAIERHAVRGVSVAPMAPVR